jgi:hypothetical protein
LQVYNLADCGVRRYKKNHPEWDPGVVGDTTKEPWKSAHLKILPGVLGYLFLKDTKREPSIKELKESIPKYEKAARDLMKTMLSAPMTLEKEALDKELEEAALKKEQEKAASAHGEVSVTTAAKPTTAAKGGKATAAKGDKATAPTEEQQEASEAPPSGQFTHTHTQMNSLSALNSR